MPAITVVMILALVADGQAGKRSAVNESICSISLQTLIDSTPSDGTVSVPACVYRETVTISRPMTVIGYGAVIDGRDATGAPSVHSGCTCRPTT